MSKTVVICVIDDDDVHKYVFNRVLKKAKPSLEVLMFSDGDEALDFILDNVENTENLPDVIFLDMQMPIMNGFEFMKEYNKIKPRVGKKITTYMVSSSKNPNVLEQARCTPDIADYISKPIDPRELNKLAFVSSEDEDIGTKS